MKKIDLIKSLREFFCKAFCFWCAGITFLIFISTKFYTVFLHSMSTKSIKEILSFEVGCTIGLLAVLIALAALKPSSSGEATRITKAYQFKAVVASFFTLIFASIAYIGVTIVWGYHENWESYNNWIPMITTGLFFYTISTSFIAVIAQMRTD